MRKKIASSEATQPNEIKADDTVAPTLDVSHRMPWSVWPLAGTTVGPMAVSLSHLSDGVTQLTAIPSWQAWAMAVGIDCMLISVALAQLTSPPNVKRDIAIVARCMEAGTLVMTAGLNALAFTGGPSTPLIGRKLPSAVSCRRQSVALRISWPDLHGADLDPAGPALSRPLVRKSPCDRP